jgi:hypothetical protein
MFDEKYITSEELKSMKVGDSFTAGVFLPGISKEQLRWELIALLDYKGACAYTFSVRYMDTYLSTWQLAITEDNIIVGVEV